MPAQIGMLGEAHTVPVWVLSRTRESITALEHRLHQLPSQYATGLAVRNLFFGDAAKFVPWKQARSATDSSKSIDSPSTRGCAEPSLLSPG